MWWALQTVTTVGYGDVTPHRPIGRVIAAVAMLEGIALLTILTAAITSMFVARAARDQRVEAEAADSDVRLEAQLDAIAQRLDRIEQTLRN
jgi:voltage-gated potassium channel